MQASSAQWQGLPQKGVTWRLTESNAEFCTKWHEPAGASATSPNIQTSTHRASKALDRHAPSLQLCLHCLCCGLPHLAAGHPAACRRRWPLASPMR